RAKRDWSSDVCSSDLNLLDEDKGYNLTIEKKGSGMQTEYSVRPRKNESAIPSDSWESELVDIVKLATPKSYEERLAILEGKDSRSEERRVGKRDRERA